jgi:hypothetical protein
MPEAAHREAPPARACHSCGARQDECQEICVECGAAVPRARKAGARVRSAVRPLALAAFAALVVTSAAYGLSADAGRDSAAVKVAAAPPQAARTPATTAAAPQPAPAPAPAPTPPATAAAPPPPTTPAPAPKPATPAPSPAPAPNPAPTPSPSAGSPTPSGGSTRHGHQHHSGSGNSGSTHARTRSHSHRPAWLSEGDQPYSATLYDPYADGSDEHASAAPRAVDGSARTAWTTADHPGGLGKQGVGLVVEASGYQSYSALGIQTATPGFAVSIYSTDASDPPQGGPDQPGWKLEATKASVAKQQRIALKGATPNPHYLIVWITKLPPGKSRAGLSEVSLLP